MSSGLDLVSQLTPQTADQGLSKAPSTFSDAFSTAMNAAGFAPDEYWNARNAQSERFQKIADDYYALKGERLLNPFDVSITRDEMRKYPNMPIPYVLQKRLEVAREKTRIARDEVGDRGGVDPDFLNVDRINTAIGQTGEAMRHANEALVGTGQGVAQFMGGVVGGSVAPHNIAAGLVPVSRLPMATAEGIGRTFLGNVGREAALQAGVGAGATAVGEAAGYGTREQFGTAPTGGEIASNIFGGAVGGALFGGGLRGTHLALGRLIHGPQVEIRPGESGPAIEVPRTVKDAQVVMQTGDLYGHSNKLGIPEPEHDRIFLAAAPDVAAGRGAVVDIEPPVGARAEAGAQVKPLPAGLEFRVTHQKGLTDVAIVDATGTKHYELTFRTGDGVVTDAFNLTREHSGLGEGLYIKAMQAASEQGIQLKGAGSEYAQRVWQSLEERGLATKGTAQGDIGPYTQWTQAAEAALPVPAAEAERAVADARLQGAAAEPTWAKGKVEANEVFIGNNAAGEPVYSRPDGSRFSIARDGDELRFQESSTHGMDSERIRVAEPAAEAAPARGPELDPVLQRLVDEVRNPPVEEGRPDFAAAATPTRPEEVVPKTAAVQAEENKAVIAEAQALVERPDREVPRELRKALADATDDEAEAAIAVACLAGGGAL